MVDYVKACLKEPVPREWAFPESEYRDRLDKVYTAMDEAEIDVLLVHAIVDMCYLTGYQTLWPEAYTCLIVPRDGEPFMQVGEIEAGLAILHGPIKDLETFSWVGSDVAPNQLARILEARGFARKRIGVQAGRIEMGLRGPLDAATYLRLKELLPNAQLHDATLLMFNIRVTKSPAELEHMRRAAGISDAGMAAAIDIAAVGLTDNDLSAIGAKVMIDHGSESFSIDPISSTGHRSGWFHTTFKRFPLNPGDHLLLEFGGCYQRYTSPIMRTVILGEPSDMARRIIDANQNALESLYSNVKAGRTAHDVAVEVAKEVKEIDDQIFRSGHFGYSIGLGFAPTWTDGPMYIAEGNDRVLEVGMTFHTPLSFRIPAEFVIGVSESIAVTETGCEILTKLDRKPVIKLG
ncbi:MAG: aminopeptidase P family protein [Chloroflexi bacterium]|nr:aminopeptidase P family protein [Chloroflexota bacterium]